MCTNTNDIAEQVNWRAELGAEITRYIRAGLSRDSAKIAAVDAINFRRDIARHNLSFMTTPAQPIEDVHGIPLAVGEATFEATRFPVDHLGRIAPTWTVGGDR